MSIYLRSLPQSLYLNLTHPLQYTTLTFEDPVFSESLAFTESNNILYDLLYSPLKIFIIEIGLILAVWLVQNCAIKQLFQTVTGISIPSLLSTFPEKYQIIVKKVYLKILIPFPASEKLYELYYIVKNTLVYKKWIYKNKYRNIYIVFAGGGSLMHYSPGIAHVYANIADFIARYSSVYSPHNNAYMLDVNLAHSLSIYGKCGDLSFLRKYVELHPENLVIGKAVALAYHEFAKKHREIAEDLLIQFGPRNYYDIFRTLTNNDEHFAFCNTLRKHPHFFDSPAFKNIGKKGVKIDGSIGGNETTHAGNKQFIMDEFSTTATDEIKFFGQPDVTVNERLDNFGLTIKRISSKKEQIILLEDQLVNQDQPLTLTLIKSAIRNAQIEETDTQIIAGESTIISGLNSKINWDYMIDKNTQSLVKGIVRQIESIKINKYAEKGIADLSHLQENAVSVSLNINLNLVFKGIETDFFLKETQQAITESIKDHGMVGPTGSPLLDPKISVSLINDNLVPYTEVADSLGITSNFPL